MYDVHHMVKELQIHGCHIRGAWESVVGIKKGFRIEFSVNHDFDSFHSNQFNHLPFDNCYSKRSKAKAAKAFGHAHYHRAMEYFLKAVAERDFPPTSQRLAEERHYWCEGVGIRRIEVSKNRSVLELEVSYDYDLDWAADLGVEEEEQYV